MMDAMPENRTRFNKVALVTATRDDLVDISLALARGMGRDFFADPASPVLVSIRGSFGRGKKIIPDIICGELLGPEIKRRFSGRKEYDEYWSSRRKADPLEFHFINMAWGSGYSNKSLNDKLVIDREGKLKEFLATRSAGGITFVHNSPEFSRNISDLDIWIEAQACHSVDGEGFREKGYLSEAFRSASDQAFSEWVRYVEISVRDERLRDAPSFQQALQEIARIGAGNGRPLLRVQADGKEAPSWG